VGNLGSVAADLKDFAEAQARFEDARRIAREIGDRRLEAVWLASLGQVAVDLDRFAEATVRFQAALRIARELGTDESDLFEACAGLLSRLDRCEIAAQLLAAADAIRVRTNVARSSLDHQRYDATVTMCRERLSKDDLARASAEGSALDAASALDLALDVLAELESWATSVPPEQ